MLRSSCLGLFLYGNCQDRLCDAGEPVSDNAAPDYNNIVTTLDMKIASDALQRCIDRWAAYFDRLADQSQWDEDYLADCLLMGLQDCLLKIRLNLCMLL